MDVFYYQIVEGITFNKSYFINSVVIYYLRLDSHLLKKIICFNESLSKLMKNAFYFILKVHFVLKIFKFCLDVLVMLKKTALLEIITLISKFITSQFDQQTIAIHILPNIPRSKGNQATKFGLLIKYNFLGNIFLQKLCRK